MKKEAENWKTWLQQVVAIFSNSNDEISTFNNNHTTAQSQRVCFYLFAIIGNANIHIDRYGALYLYPYRPLHSTTHNMKQSVRHGETKHKKQIKTYFRHNSSFLWTDFNQYGNIAYRCTYLRLWVWLWTVPLPVQYTCKKASKQPASQASKLSALSSRGIWVCGSVYVFLMLIGAKRLFTTPNEKYVFYSGKTVVCQTKLFNVPFMFLR